MKIYQIRRGLDTDKNFFVLDNSDDYCNDYCDVYPEIKEKLKVIKGFIDIYRDRWDGAKKQTNDYEYIYTSTNPNKNICSIIPISRSYFKLREIMYDLNLTCDGKVACLAEAPGGFIQSLMDMFHSQIDIIHGITLISENNDIPFWNNGLLKETKVKISYGDDKTGDLYNVKNLLHFINEVQKSSCSLVTADGGFDYSDDFNSQEYVSYQLIYSEVFLALSLLKEGGTFICKIFDIFTIHTIGILYLLYLSFDDLVFIKPVTSRSTNSEKYVVCKGYKGYDKEKSNILFTLLLTDNIYDFTLDIPHSFYEEMKRYNEDFTNSQISIIQKTVYFAKNRSKSFTPSYKQIKNGKEWCRKYKLPINNIFNE